MINETKLREYIQKAIEAGWRIVDGTWIDQRNKCCCPMGAVVVMGTTGEGGPVSYSGMAAHLLDSSASEVIEFSCGFDDWYSCAKDDNSFNLGRKFRGEFVRVPISRED